MSHLVPEPEVAPEAAGSSEQPLVFNVSEWEQGWLIKVRSGQVPYLSASKRSSSSKTCAIELPWALGASKLYANKFVLAHL